MIETRLKAVGGWIDVSFDGETVTMAAVGPPLQMLVREPANTAQRQKRTDERGRYRRMALDALREAGAGPELDDAFVDWTYRRLGDRLAADRLHPMFRPAHPFSGRTTDEEWSFMGKTKELLLAGTMIPVLIGAGPGFAASPPSPAPWLMAQAEPGGPGEDQRKHPPGKPGAEPHQAPEGRPAAQPRPAEPPAPRQAAPEAPRPAAPKPEAPAHQAPAPRAAEPEPATPRAAPKPAAPQPHAEEPPAARQPAPRAAEPEAPARAAPKAAAPEAPEPRNAPKQAAPAAPKPAEPEATPQKPAPKAAAPEAAPAQRAVPKPAEPQAAPAKPEPAQPEPAKPNPAVQPRPNAEPRNANPEAPARAGAPRPAAEPNGAAPGTQPPGAERPAGATPNRTENLRQTAPNQPPPGQPAPGQPPAAPAAAPATNASPEGGRPVAPAQPNAAAAPANGRPAAPPPAPPPPPPPPPAAPQAAPGQAQAPGQPGARRRGDRGGDNATGAIVGAAAGFVGGFLAAQAVQNFNQVQADRQVFTDDGVNIIREPGRTIVEQDDRYFIAHDENERFRELGYDLNVRRADGYEVASYAARDGSSIYTYTDAQGRLVRRVREYPDGRSVILIDNRYDRYDRNFVEDVVTLPPLPPAELPPPDRYIVDAADAPPTVVYDTLSAPPIAPLPRRYTLDQIRYSPDIRARMRSVDLNTITFATGSWTVSPDQAPKLASIASAINAAIRQNPKEIYMVEGYTDATGNPADNLSLSDRRAQSVATILTRDFQVPPENLVTQGYGAQFLKVQTQGPSVENRRVAVRRITPLLNQSASGQ